MKHFQKLVIENFQSHQYTEIDFSKGLNVFVGPSDSGKSAILRALRWVLFNTPRGTDFIRTGAKECRVTLTLTDGTKIARVRGTSVNRYLLHTADGQEQVFEGFGNTVPQEITDIHHIQAIKLDQKEMLLHFGTQLESPFLLFESAQTKAKTIGRISGAHLIDQALKKANSDRQSTNSTVKQLEQQVTQIKQKLEPYENLSLLEERLVQAENAYKDVLAKKRRAETLIRLLHELKKIRSEKQFYLEIIQKLEHLPQAELLLLELEKKKLLYQQLTRQNEKWLRIKEEKARWQLVVDQSTSLPLASESMTTLETHYLRFHQLLQLHMKWKQHKQQKEQLQGLIQKLTHVPHLVGTMQKVEEKIARLKSYTHLAKQWNQIKTEKKQVKEMIDLHHPTIHLTAQWIPSFEEKIERIKRLQTVAETLSDVRNRMGIGRHFCQEKEREIASLRGEWAELLRKLEKCPTCGSHINSSVIEHIMEEYQGGNADAAARRKD